MKVLPFLGETRLSLPGKIINEVLNDLVKANKPWRARIEESFLPPDHKAHYHELLTERFARLELQ